MKQVFHNKGSTVDQHGARQRTDAFEDFYEFTSTGLKDFPLVENPPVDTATDLDSLAARLTSLMPSAVLSVRADCSLATRNELDAAKGRAAQIRRLMVGTQEELDWRCYRLYALLPAGMGVEDLEHKTPVEVELGERAFEIVLARRMAAGRADTTWFNRHGSTPTTEIPTQWPETYRRVVARRIELIEHDKSIGLIERPEFKRSWNLPNWDDLEQTALRDWLLARLESKALWPASPEQPALITTTSRLADTLQRDTEFMQIAALYAGHADFDVSHLVAELVSAESVPFLPTLRYTDTGLRKRTQWEGTWAWQRREDAIDADVVATEGPGWRAELTADARTRFKLVADVPLSVEARDWVELRLTSEIKRYQDGRKTNEIGPIPVPPKYQGKDFVKTDYWRMRGGLDVPKERWVSYPGCERGADGSLPIAWAGWDHLQQATALAAYYLEMKESEGWEAARLQPLLAGLLELVPWLEQWHNEVDSVYGERMGAYYKGFVSEEARSHGFTLDDLRTWKPAAGPVRRGRRRSLPASGA